VLPASRTPSSALNANAMEYAKPINARYLGYSNAYKLDAESIDDPTEVYSLMREVPMPPKDFITRYYDDGTDKHHERR
jgi:hypothetical protein